MIGSVLRQLWRNYTTAQWSSWWANRKIDWKAHYFANWNHPHRQMLSTVLKTFSWVSLMEIGCGAGANLAQIVATHKGNKQLGGIDISPDAIECAKKNFNGAFFKVCSADDIMMSDNSTDVVISDMCLIYFGPRKIQKVVSEMYRVARTHVVLCEFHCDSWWDRMKLLFSSGLHGHNYRRLLERHGFTDVTLYKMPEACWPEGDEVQKKFAHVIVGRVPRRKLPR